MLNLLLQHFHVHLMVMFLYLFDWCVIFHLWNTYLSLWYMLKVITWVISLYTYRYTYRYTVTSRMTPVLRWAAIRAIFLCFINFDGQSHKTVSTDHSFWRERRAEADSNRGPSAYQPNALPLGQTGSLVLVLRLFWLAPDSQREEMGWGGWVSGGGGGYLTPNPWRKWCWQGRAEEDTVAIKWSDCQASAGRSWWVRLHTSTLLIVTRDPTTSSVVCVSGWTL